jgi:hypothetical protein
MTIFNRQERQDFQDKITRSIPSFNTGTLKLIKSQAFGVHPQVEDHVKSLALWRLGG